MNPIFAPSVIFLVFAALCAVAGILSYRSMPGLPRFPRVSAATLRVLAVASLAIPLLNPGYWAPLVNQVKSRWVVLVDRSESMAANDVEGKSRWEEALRLAKSFETEVSKAGLEIEVATFAKGLDASRGEKPDGTVTDLKLAIENAMDRFGGSQVNGVLLLSDGHQTVPADSTSVLMRAQAMRMPVFPIPLGTASKAPDLEVQPHRNQYVLFRGQQHSVSARVRATQTGPREVTLFLKDSAGKEVAKNAARLREGEEGAVSFPLPSLTPGLHHFTISADPLPNERNTGNNSGKITVHVVDEPIRVLLVEGSPYWDTKFIAQLLQREKGYEFQVIYRLAEARFFKVEANRESEETEGEALKSFPSTVEELSKYDLVVLGRSVETFLDASSARALTQWVEERGGGLLLARGKPVTTAVPELEPLYPHNWDREFSQEYSWRPTFAGEDSGLFGSSLPGRNATIWAELPRLKEGTYGETLRPFTRVLVEGVSRGGDREASFPAVVARRIGQGYVVSVNSDDLWRWGFIPNVQRATTIYRDFWFQLFDWMIAYSDFIPGKKHALRLNRAEVETDRPVKLRVLRRASMSKENEPPPKVYYTRDGLADAPVELALVADANLPHSWDAILSIPAAGDYLFSLKSGAGEEEAVYASLKVKGPPGELEDVSVDRPALETIATGSGGRLVEEKDFRALVEETNREGTREDASEWKSLWDSAGVAILMLALFAGEWIIRRRQGLL